MAKRKLLRRKIGGKIFTLTYADDRKKTVQWHAKRVRAAGRKARVIHIGAGPMAAYGLFVGPRRKKRR